MTARRPPSRRSPRCRPLRRVGTGPLGLLAAVACLVLAAACSSGGTAAPPTSAATAGRAATSAPAVAPGTRAPAASTSAPPTTAAPVDDEAAVLAAYQGFWDTWLAANDPPNPDHPGLARYAAGDALTHTRSEITKNRAAGIALRLPAGSVGRHSPVIASVDGNTARISDCAIDDGLVVQISTGAIVNSSVATWLFDARLSRGADGAWRVTSSNSVIRRDGATSCD